MLIALALLLTTLGYAVKGRSPWGTVSGRVAWFIAVAEAALLLGYAPIVAVLMGAGATIGGLISHGHYFAMGRYAPNVNDWLNTGNSKYAECAWAMFLIGCLMGLFTFTALDYQPSLLILLVGLAHAVAYSIPMLWAKRTHILYSELIFGLIFGLLLWLAA